MLTPLLLLLVAAADGGTEQPLISGPFDKELIRGAIKEARPAIAACYQTAQASKPGLEGTVKLKFTITATGAVGKTERVSDTTGDPQLVSCVEKIVEGFVFRKPKGGGVVIVTYPFVFRLNDPEDKR